MAARDPRRILRTIRRTTAGSLVAAAVGTGVVAVHLAGDHASAAAAAAQVDEAPSATTPRGQGRAAPSPQGFAPVAPVQPGGGPAQSRSHGS